MGIAQYHYFKKVPFYANSNIYPLSYEMCGSKANFESTKMLDESYYINNRIAPTHLRSASEMLLFIMDEEGGSLNEKFKIDIENIKSELEIEGMQLSNEDIELLEMYSSKEINKDQLIDTIKSNVLEGLKNNARLV